MKLTTTISALALIAVSGCGRSGSPEEGRQTAAITTGDAKGGASGNPICKLFSQAEAAAYIGESVTAGENAAGGKGCQWPAADGDGQVTVAVVPSEFEERASAAEGFRKVPEVGKDGFVVPDMGGWVAGAVQGKSFYRVTTAGNKASDVQALALLKEVMKRQP